MIPTLLEQVRAAKVPHASPTKHKFAPTYTFKEDSQPMRVFRLMDEDADSVWTVERIMDAFDLPRSSVTSALRRLARKGLVEMVGKEVRHTKPRYLWRVKGEARWA